MKYIHVLVEGIGWVFVGLMTLSYIMKSLDEKIK